ncbi:MAG: OmpA family protein [Verrucomicrobiota bacterium]|jgi:peptidoglycan-associated lipoprotein
MKTSSLLSILFAGAALTLGSAGCVHKPGTITPLPDSYRPPPPGTKETNPGPGTGMETPRPITTTDVGTPFDTNGPWKGPIEDGTPDAVTLKPDTVYFDLDSSTIKKSEDKKLEDVAAYLKGHMADALRVEGNCDERGTEKYNLALGERRALAVREYLINLGIDSRQVVTVTYGKAKPAVDGHNEAAWSKNRRGDFVLLVPKTP